MERREARCASPRRARRGIRKTSEGQGDFAQAGPAKETCRLTCKKIRLFARCTFLHPSEHVKDNGPSRTQTTVSVMPKGQEPIEAPNAGAAALCSGIPFEHCDFNTAQLQ